MRFDAFKLSLSYLHFSKFTVGMLKKMLRTRAKVSLVLPRLEPSGLGTLILCSRQRLTAALVEQMLRGNKHQYSD